MKPHLVIGKGQVGTALYRLLHRHKAKVDVIDRDEEAKGMYDYIHIAFPYSPSFIDDVKAYAGRYMNVGGLLIIHSTVPIGTTEQFGDDAVHSPIRGVHPHLEQGVRHFKKYFGGKRAHEAAHTFQSICHGDTTENPRDTEALKLWDTTYYGWNIIFEKALYKYCQDNALDYELIYRNANESYNEGYTKLGMKHVVRPVLNHQEGPIGGHCVMPNAELLGDARICETIIEQNKRYE